MFGWEFPPLSKGGLGTACYGLTKGLNKNGVDITFVLPHGMPDPHSHVNLIIANNLYIGNDKLKIKFINSLLCQYMTEDEYNAEYEKLAKMGLKCGNSSGKGLYGRDLYEEVRRYAEKAKVIAQFEDFDVIHAHDWMTYDAGIKAKEVSGKPLVIHVHATEFDRTGGHPNQYVYDIERKGMHAADKIIAVSNYTKQKVVEHYGIPSEKVTVVHNGVVQDPKPLERVKIGDKVVLFLGRLTLQKGPDYFIEAAKRVLEFDPDVTFVVAGTGDMYYQMVERAAELGIGDKVLFTGHLTGDDVDRAYRMADLYVMPSISEPFGITPLEALKNNTPVLISKQSGVSEVLTNVLKVDFWDIDEMTNKILSVLNYSFLKRALADHGSNEVKSITWDQSARKCMEVYNSAMGR